MRVESIRSLVTASIVLLMLISVSAASPDVHKLVIREISTVHYTTCLLNVRGGADGDEDDEQQQRIPNYVTDPVILKDPDGNEYYLAIFSNVVGVLADELPFSEMCHAFLTTNNEKYPAVKKEAPWVQSSRCYGLDMPGYDDTLKHEATVTDTGASIGLGVTSQLNNTIVYAQTPTTNFLPFDTSDTIHDIVLDTWHTHNADREQEQDDVFWAEKGSSRGEDINSPYYGYFMRVYNHHPISMNVKPVGVYLSPDFMNHFHASYSPNDLQSCLSIESIVADPDHIRKNTYSVKEETIYGVTIAGYYDRDKSPSEFFGDHLNQTAMREALELDGSNPNALGNTNFEERKYKLFERIVNPPASGYEFDFMSPFRTVTAVLDFLYIGLVFLQRRVNDGRYPSKRFDDLKVVMFLHIVAGFTILYTGVFLHVQNEVSTVTELDDEELLYRRLLYYLLALMGILHFVTILFVLPKVMGEKRITIPLYFGAGAINLVNAIRLFVEPTLKHAFLFWGSVNTFVYVRGYIVLLMLGNIDWELLYTYGILVAGATTYPLTGQNVVIFFIFVLPVVYAPFHEWVCRKFPFFTLEDDLGGNTPAEKNILQVTKMVRSSFKKKRKEETTYTNSNTKLHSIVNSATTREEFIIADKYSTSSGSDSDEGPGFEC